VSAVTATSLLTTTTGIKDTPPHMSQNILEVFENLHSAVSTDPDNFGDNKAVIQALQNALDQEMKKRVWFDGVKCQDKKGKSQKVFSNAQTRQE
jgi:hypothetical protein